MNIGILALQGNYAQHKQVLESLHIESLKVTYIRSLLDLENNDPNKDICRYSALILPGGESTTISFLLETQGMFDALKSLIIHDIPVLSTCAGTILLARKLVNDTEKSIRLFKYAHITLERNAYGRQIYSFCKKLVFACSQYTKQELVEQISNQISGLFIRAPKIVSYDKSVEVLSSFENHPVIIQERNMLMSTFHPETLTNSTLHKYFIHAIVKPYLKNSK